MISYKRGDPQGEMGDFNGSKTHIWQHYLCIFGTSLRAKASRLNNRFTY